MILAVPSKAIDLGGSYGMQDIKHQVRTYLLDNFLMGGSEQDIQDDTSFMGSHILDSTGFIELISYLEDQFGIQVTDEEMVPENLDSLKNIEHFVSRKRASANVVSE
jgi:acyl carrier protein